ncbi:hypothetical protein T4B_3624 [Trichinella pseudospiralis]|nr:hypothetical protein T4B_3624 [Trichinella pseudospiralis]
MLLDTTFLPVQQVDTGDSLLEAEADRGRHEAELWNEDIRYMRFPKGPNSVGLNRSLVSYVRWSVAIVGQFQVSEDTLNGEDAIYRSRG